MITAKGQAKGSQHTTLDSVSLWRHILGSPAAVNLGDKGKKGDTETGTALVCKVSGRLIHKALVP